MTISALRECAKQIFKHIRRKHPMKLSVFGEYGKFTLVGLTRTCPKQKKILNLLPKDHGMDKIPSHAIVPLEYQSKIKDKTWRKMYFFIQKIPFTTEHLICFLSL